MPPLATALPVAASWIERLDDDVLHAVNCRLDAPVLEWLLLNLQSKAVAVPLFAGGVLLLALWRPRRALRALLTAAARFGLCMAIATLMWATIARPRPSHVREPLLRTAEEIATCAAHPEGLAVRKHASSRPGFPSRHAMTAGVFAVALCGIGAWAGVVGVLGALLVAFGRVYAGVHWPTDVLAGLVLGALVGAATWRLWPALLALRGHRHWVEDPAVAATPGGPGADDAPG